MDQLDHKFMGTENLKQILVGSLKFCYSPGVVTAEVQMETDSVSCTFSSETILWVFPTWSRFGMNRLSQNTVFLVHQSGTLRQSSSQFFAHK